MDGGTSRGRFGRSAAVMVTGAPAVTGGRVYVGVAPDKVVALAP